MNMTVKEQRDVLLKSLDAMNRVAHSSSDELRASEKLVLEVTKLKEAGDSPDPLVVEIHGLLRKLMVSMFDPNEELRLALTNLFERTSTIVKDVDLGPYGAPGYRIEAVVFEELKRMGKERNKISAIKELRALTSMGLQQAKAVIDYVV